MANIVWQQNDYIRIKGLSNDVYKQIIINALETIEKANMFELKQILVRALSAFFDEK